MKTVGLMLIMGMAVVVSGCESLRGTFGSLSGILGIAQTTIEAKLAAEVAGTYVVEIRKDEQVLLHESWACTKGEDGKLTGCHKL